MNWSTAYKGDGIDVSYDGVVKGTYKLLQSPYCKVCSYPSSPDKPCRWTATHPTFVKRIYAMGIYTPTRTKAQTGSSDYLSRDIYFMKVNPYRAEPLGLSLAVCIRNRYPELLDYDYLVAMPQHPDELHVNEHTGELFNHIDPLARWLSSDIKLKVISPIDKHRPQSMQKLGYRERREATDGLYICNSDVAAGKRILLVDDVATTGSNLDSCAKALLGRGAKEVSAIVCGKEFLG